MRNYSASYYKLLDVVFGDGDFQGFVDNFDEKYSKIDTTGFEWAEDMLVGFSYSQIEAIMNVPVLPDVVDKGSRGTPMDFQGFEVNRGEIPRFARSFTLNEKVIREQLIMMDRLKGRVDQKMRDSMFNLLYGSVDLLIGGMNSVLTYQRDRLVSTGKIDFPEEFFGQHPLNDLGISFKIKEFDANKTETLWWKSDEHIPANEGKNADPIKDLRNIRKEMERYNPTGFFEISKDLFEDLLSHTKIIQTLGSVRFPGISDELALRQGAYILGDEAKSIIERLIGARIVIRDTKSTPLRAIAKEENFGKRELLNNFVPTNVAYLPYGKLGEIQASQPVVMGDPAAKIATFHDGRTQLLQTFDERQRNQTLDIELTALLVPSVSQQMAVKTVTK